MADADFTIRAGRPFARTIRIAGLAAVWPDADTLEVRSQLRQGEAETTPLIADIHDYMTWAYDDTDLVIEWAMTGADTRALYAVDMGLTGKRGRLTVVVSDTGAVDTRAIIIPEDTSWLVEVLPVTTSAEDAA